MSTVTLHRNCKLSPTSFNAAHKESVSFQFNNTGTLNLSPSSFFGQATVSANANLTVQGSAGDQCTITVQAGTCTPTLPTATEGDSCVITVSGTPRPHPPKDKYK